VVRELGWQPPRDWTDRSGRPLLHFAMGHPRGLPDVELHWRVHWYEEAFAERALARAEPAPDGLRLADEDVFAFLLLFHARDGLTGLRLPADALAWGERLAGRPPVVPRLAREHPRLAPALLAAAAGVAQVAGRPVAWLDAPAPGTAAARWAVALADPLLRMPGPQRRAERALVDVLLAPAGQRPASVRRQLVPPHEVMRRHLRGLETAGRLRMLAASSGHLVRLLRRFGLAPLLRATRPTALP
jgi:hypothetical protein